MYGTKDHVPIKQASVQNVVHASLLQRDRTDSRDIDLQQFMSPNLRSA